MWTRALPKRWKGTKTPRLTFMYNYFVLVGPKDDPAGCAAAASAKDAFANIAAGKFPFVSRGDLSGTHNEGSLPLAGSARHHDGRGERRRL